MEALGGAAWIRSPARSRLVGGVNRLAKTTYFDPAEQVGVSNARRGTEMEERQPAEPHDTTGTALPSNPRFRVAGRESSVSSRSLFKLFV